MIKWIKANKGFVVVLCFVEIAYWSFFWWATHG
jgi:hypothetical protein